MASSQSSPVDETRSAPQQSNKSDWFRNSVLFWSSQNRESFDGDGMQRQESFDSEGMMTDCTSISSGIIGENPYGSSVASSLTNVSRFSFEGSNSTLADLSKRDNYDPADLLRQVEELERCFRPESRCQLPEFGVGNSVDLYLENSHNPLINDKALVNGETLSADETLLKSEAIVNSTHQSSDPITENTNVDEHLSSPEQTANISYQNQTISSYNDCNQAVGSDRDDVHQNATPQSVSQAPALQRRDQLQLNIEPVDRPSNPTPNKSQMNEPFESSPLPEKTDEDHKREKNVNVIVGFESSDDQKVSEESKPSRTSVESEDEKSDDDNKSVVSFDDSGSHQSTPYMTLEFPCNAVVKSSPLYEKAPPNDQVKELSNSLEMALKIFEDASAYLSETLPEKKKSASEKAPLTKGSSQEPVSDHEDSEDEVDPPKPYPDPNVFNSIKRVQETLLEISQEIHKSKSQLSLTDRDPNTVMNDMLSRIKPPPFSRDSGSYKVQTESEIIETDLDAPALPPKQRNSFASDNEGETSKILQSPFTMNAATTSPTITPAMATPPTGLPDSSIYRLLEGANKRKYSEHRLRRGEPSISEQIESLDDFAQEMNLKTPTRLSAPSKPSRSPPKCSPLLTHSRERFDSAIASGNSTPSSPHLSPLPLRHDRDFDVQSPVFNYDSGYGDTIRSSCAPIVESVSETDEMLGIESSTTESSDWNTLSTCASVSRKDRSPPKYVRSMSMPKFASSPSTPPPMRVVRRSTGSMATANLNNSFPSSNPQVSRDSITSLGPFLGSCEALYSEQELCAIKKFLTLTSHFFEQGGSSASNSVDFDPIDEYSNSPEIHTIKKSIDQQRHELSEQRQQQEELLHQLGDMLVQVMSMKEEHCSVRQKQTKALGLLKKQLDQHKKQQKEAHTDILSKVNRISSVVGQINPQSPNLPHPSPRLGSKLGGYGRPAVSPQNMSHGELIWKVTDFTKKLNKTKNGMIEGVLVSPHFSTGQYGYRMNAWMYLNGRGNMFGKYLSVYVCVIVGDYDAILPWPIGPSYTFTVVDQNPRLSEKRDHVKVRRVLDIAGKGGNIIAKSGGIPRPADSTKALIVGFDDFIQHNMLLERHYLVDDVLFLKVEAEIPC